MRLRKLSTLFGILAFLATFAFSTSAFAKKFMIGVKGGGNMANFVGKDAGTPDQFSGVSKKPLLGFNGGLQAAINLGMLGIQVEGLYSVKGQKYTSNNSDASVVTRLNYFEIPVLARFNISIPGVPLTPKLVAGPGVSFFMGGKTKMEGGSLNGETNIKKDSITSPDIGIVAGGGLDIGMGPGALTIDVRYERGFSKIFDDTDAKVFNSRVTGQLGYAIGF